MNIKTIFKAVMALSVLVAVPSLAGCSHQNASRPCWVGSQQTLSEMRQSDINALKAAGVQVIRLGETYKLVISSDDLFYPRTGELVPEASAVLNTVARFLNSYHIITVRVAAYSDFTKSIASKIRLTTAQATSVQSYLSDRGINARLIYADGQGSKNTVATNFTIAGRRANRRIEISFMYIPKYTRAID